MFRERYGLRFSALVALASVWFWPALAFAEEGEDWTGAEVYGNILIVLGVVATVYLLSYLLLGWLTRQYGFVTGVQYVVLGMVAVPMTGWLAPQVVLSFEPLVALAVGAVGLAAGLQVNARRLVDQRAATVKLALTVTAMTVVVVMVLPLLAFYQWADPGFEGYWVPAILALGAMALVADGRQLTALADFFEVEASVIAEARELAWLSTAVAVAAFGLVFSFYNPGLEFFGGLADMGIWLGVHLLAGGIVGAVGGSLIQARPDDDRVLTILLGVVLTASAVAYVTTLSIVFVTFAAGVVLINMSSESLRIRNMLESASAPLYILLLFFAGTMWTPGMRPVGFLLIGGYLVLRFVGRAAGVALYRPRLSGFRPEPGIHRALWAPGALTAAMILDYGFGFAEMESVSLVVSAFVLILIAEEVISFVLARGWMIDISDADPSRRRASPWGDWKGGS